MGGRCKACFGGITFAVDILILSLTSSAKPILVKTIPIIDYVKRLKQVRKVKEDGA